MSENQNDVINNLNKEIGIINLISGVIDGEEFWAYLSIAPDKYEDFLEAEKSGPYDVTKYGDILKWGKGLTPPESDISEMVETYGIVPDMQERLKGFEDDLLK